MRFRETTDDELDVVYKMGFDAWSAGLSYAQYLTSCRKSSKYKKGTWYVLERDGELLSSLIVYRLHDAIGIGSIATPPALRRKKFASRLIQLVIEKYESENPQTTFFLYSDIHSDFYKKFGFFKVAEDHQRYLPSVCMIRGPNIQNIPDYF